ncbi:MAG: hypothetical protein FWD17_12240 [Polyangiaceae bacterium]|nr:hypothetical protein [Polyangiaceae bacterium]
MVSFVNKVAGFAVASLLVAGSHTSLSNGARARDRCRPIHGTTSSLFTTQNCTSATGLCTSGTITGAGPLDGAYFFTALDVAPSAGLPASEPAGNISFSGQVDLTTKKGTLVARDLGVLDAQNGYFTEVDRPISGTGSFANPSHDFFISGIVNPAGNGFIGELSGTICSDRDSDDE